jgi:membrane protein insertase Oxa1/YidC/SpoIIIJ
VIIAAAAAVAQYYQSKQLMPQSKDARGLRAILSEAGQGKQADQSEVNAAVGRSTMFLVPVMVFIFAIRLALALPLYWLASSVIAYIQQSRILKDDANEADNKVAATKTKKIAQPRTMQTKSGLKVTRRTIDESPTKPKAKKTSKANRANRRRRK